MRGIAPLIGLTVSQVNIRRPSLRWPIPRLLVDTLPNSRLSRLTRRAKYILAEFNDANDILIGTLILHLGMSGRICLLAQDETAAKHDHFDICFLGGQVLRLRDPRRFGAVLWVDANESVGAHPLM